MNESEKARSKRLLDCFKLTIEKWNVLNLYQKGLCWICLKPQNGGKRLATDHSWISGEVRGLLCHRCNTLLGKIERPSRSGQPWTLDELERVIEYKQHPPARWAWDGPHYGYVGDVSTKKHRKMLKRLKKIQNRATTQTSMGERN